MPKQVRMGKIRDLPQLSISIKNYHNGGLCGFWDGALTISARLICAMLCLI